MDEGGPYYKLKVFSSLWPFEGTQKIAIHTKLNMQSLLYDHIPN